MISKHIELPTNNQHTLREEQLADQQLRSKINTFQTTDLVPVDFARHSMRGYIMSGSKLYRYCGDTETE